MRPLATCATLQLESMTFSHLVYIYMAARVSLLIDNAHTGVPLTSVVHVTCRVQWRRNHGGSGGWRPRKGLGGLLVRCETQWLRKQAPPWHSWQASVHPRRINRSRAPRAIHSLIKQLRRARFARPCNYTYARTENTHRRPAQAILCGGGTKVLGAPVDETIFLHHWSGSPS